MWVMGVAVAVGLLAAAPLGAQEKDAAWAASQAPAETCLVATVRNLQELETSLKAIVGPEGEKLDVVQSVEKGLVPGAFDVAGSLVLVMLPGENEPRVVLMVRIKDESLLKGESLEGGILKVSVAPPPPSSEAKEPPAEEMPAEEMAAGKDLYVLKRDGWAAVSENLDDVKALAAAGARLELSDAQRQAIGAHTLWIYVNPAWLKTAAASACEEKEAASEPPEGESPVPPASKKMLDWLADLLNQVQTMEVAADVAPTGVTAEFAIGLAEGSALLAVAGAGLPLETFESALPASDQLMTAGWGRIQWTAAMPPLKILVKPLLDLFTEEKGAKAGEGRTTDEIWDAYERYVAVLGPDVAMLMEPAPSGQGMYRIVETFAVKDADQYRRQMAELIEISKGWMKDKMSLFGAMPEMPGVTMETEYKEAAETIEGLPVDVMTMKAKAAESTEASPQAKAQLDTMMNAMYGPEGMAIRTAVIDHLGVVVLGDAETMARAIRAARREEPRLLSNPKVAAAVGRLPKGVCGAAVISVPHYLYMIMSMTDSMMGRFLPPAVLEAAKAAGLEPLAPPALGDLVKIAGRLDGRTVRLNLDVPASEVQGAIDVAKQGARRMQWIMNYQMEMMRKQMEEMGRMQSMPPAEEGEPSRPGTEPQPAEPPAKEPAAAPEPVAPAE
jgi:hypothetical protein